MGLKKLIFLLSTLSILLGTPKKSVAPTIPYCPPKIGINITKFNSSKMEEPHYSAIEKIVGEGYSTIVLNPLYYQDFYNSSKIKGMSEFKISNLEEIIDLCKGLHAETAIKPLVNSKDNKPRTEINPKNIREWETSYMNIIKDLSKVAILKKVNYFVVGTELSKIFNKDPAFFSLVSDYLKKQGFEGTTLYATEFTGLHDLSTVKKINDLNIDAAGIDFYVSMEKKDSTNAKWEPEYYLKKIKEKLPSKKMYISEIGYRSVKSGNKWPMFNYKINGPIDENIQSGCYKNFLESSLHFNHGKRLVEGVFLWVTNSPDFSQDFYNFNPTGYSIFKKPAEKTVMDFIKYSKQLNNNSIKKLYEQN